MILGVPKTCQASPFSAFLAVLASLSFSNLQIYKGGVGFKSPSPHQITCFRIGASDWVGAFLRAAHATTLRREGWGSQIKQKKCENRTHKGTMDYSVTFGIPNRRFKSRRLDSTAKNSQTPPAERVA